MKHLGYRVSEHLYNLFNAKIKLHTFELWKKKGHVCFIDMFS